MDKVLDDEGKMVGMVLEANKYVRYACISDPDGNILWNSRRNDIESMINLEDTKNSLQFALRNWKERNEFAQKVGPGQYAIDAFKNLKRVTVPLRNNHLLYVHVEGEKPEYVLDIIKIADWVQDNPTN